MAPFAKADQHTFLNRPAFLMLAGFPSSQIFSIEHGNEARFFGILGSSSGEGEDQEEEGEEGLFAMNLHTNLVFLDTGRFDIDLTGYKETNTRSTLNYWSDSVLNIYELL
jgi:hypothetical protein